jgi:GDP-L-fucose synthase
VFLAAARVGGILANSTFPAEFVHENLVIQSNVIHEAWRAGVQRLLFLGSSCIYPRDCPQPIREDHLLTGPLEPTNRPYAIAKIAGIEMCWSYNRQYGTRYLAAMPTNLYGPGDNYHPMNSHVLPALIRRFHEATQAGAPSVTCWGSGKPMREFLHVDDLGEACVFALESWQPGSDDPPHLNVGTGVDLTIRELAEQVTKATGYPGEIIWDTSKPDGTPKKQLDVSRLAALGWRARIPLAEGLVSTVADFADGGSSRL